jgi:hypothetical protein
VKNPQIPGGEAVIRGNFISGDVGGTGMRKLPTVWIDKDVVNAPQQGIVSALAFDADRVRIRNARAPSGGATYRLARAGKGDAEVKLALGGETLRLIFDFTSERSVMNARAALLLEREGLARRTGQVGLWSPVPAFAVPVEAMRPAPGARLAGLPLQEPVVRITKARAQELDARAAAGIMGDSANDPDAIVVTAEKQKERGREPWLLIGRDVLRFCGTVELDRSGVAWVLTCQFPAQAAAPFGSAAESADASRQAVTFRTGRARFGAGCRDGTAASARDAPGPPHGGTGWLSGPQPGLPPLPLPPPWPAPLPLPGPAFQGFAACAFGAFGLAGRGLRDG